MPVRSVTDHVRDLQRSVSFHEEFLQSNVIALREAHAVLDDGLPLVASDAPAEAAR